MESDPGLFRTLLEQKEKEIISLCEHQMSTLQQQVNPSLYTKIMVISVRIKSRSRQKIRSSAMSDKDS